MRIELLKQLLLRHVAHKALRLASVLEEDHRRDRADPEASSGDRIRVHIELHDAELRALFTRDLFEDRGDHAAGAAPGGPEVDEHRLIRLEDLRLEGRVSHNCWLRHIRPPGPFTI